MNNRLSVERTESTTTSASSSPAIPAAAAGAEVLPTRHIP